MSEAAKHGESAAKPAVPLQVPKNDGNPAFRMMGLPRLRKKLPSRNWSIFLGITGSFIGAIMYDRYHKKKIQQKWCDAVSHLSREPLPADRLPRKITVVLSSPPGDGLRSAREHFQEYVKPILVAAAMDWDVIEARREGDIRAGIAERIRRIRRKNGEPSTVELEEGAIEEVRERMGVIREDPLGADLIIGRHVWKEYVRGVHEGWLGPLDPPVEPTQDTAPSAISSEPSPDASDLTSKSDSSPASAMVSPVAGEDQKSSEETPKATQESDTKGETPKPKPKPTPVPPYITPASYPTSTPAPTTPATLPHSTVLPLPHILGFINTPIRMYRFLTRRYLADKTGSAVATFVLSPTTRAFDHSDPAFAAGLADRFSGVESSPTAEGSESSHDQWEQQTILAQEESEWHKSARAPNSSGEEGKERPWLEPMIIDPRIGARMRTTMGVALPPPNDAVLETTKETTSPGLIPPTNSRLWKGGADRPELVSWAEWTRDFFGMTPRNRELRGPKDGLIGDEDS